MRKIKRLKRPSKRSVKKNIKISFSKKAKSSKISKGRFNIPLTSAFYTSYALSVVSVVAVIITQKYLPPELPLFYGMAEGEEQLSTSLGLIIPGLVAITLNLINTAIIILVENEFLQQTLVLAGLAVSVFAAITTIKIMFLVGSF